MMSVALVALLIAIICVAFELHESILPQYRKGCNECDAHKRRAEEAQRELAHDYSHKQGFHCGDERCPRNPKMDA